MAHDLGNLSGPQSSSMSTTTSSSLGAGTGPGKQTLVQGANPGVGAVQQQQQRGEQTDTARLPDGQNFQVLADATVLTRNAWLAAAPDRKTGEDGGLVSVERMTEILRALRATHLTWIDASDIPRLAAKLEFSGFSDKTTFARYHISFGVYQLIGPPPGVDVIVARSGGGMSAIVRQSLVVPGAVESAKTVDLSPAVRDKIVTGIEGYTHLKADPAARNALINGRGKLPVTVDPSTKGVSVAFDQGEMERLFGAEPYRAYLKQPAPADSGVPSNKTDGTRIPQWLPKGSLDVTPKLTQYVTGASVQVALAWDLAVHAQAELVLLPGHCEYVWTVLHNGKQVDRDTALFSDNRTTSLTLAGDPGLYEIDVVATSRHFVTPDRTFRTKIALTAVDEKQADQRAFDLAATGADGPFVRDATGLHLKPGEKALSTADELESLAITEGAIAELLREGKLTQTDYDVLKAELAKQRTALESVASQTSSGTPYIVRGTFLSREDSNAMQLKLLMHTLDRGATNGQGHYKVLLHDTTFGEPTQHPGSAEGPVAGDGDAAYTKLEVGALDDMADHFHAHNDLPSGTVHLAAQQQTAGTVWETTRDTDNGRKTAKKVLGGAALVGGVALLFIPGGGLVSAAVFAVTATAGAAAVGLEIEDRVAKEGRLKIDRRLALDVLQLVSVALPFGTLTRVLSEASTVAKAGYLLSMTSVDVAQGFLIAAAVRDQLKLIEASTAFALAQATTDEQRAQIMADRNRKVGQVIGGAMVNGAFILISLGVGMKRISATMRNGTRLSVREPVANLRSQGRTAMKQALERGWFEHADASGKSERVVLSEDERGFLEQEVGIKEPASKKEPENTLPEDELPVRTSEHPQPADKQDKQPVDKQNNPVVDKNANPSGRITDPVPGLYDSIDPTFEPKGWTFDDSPVHPNPAHPDWLQIRTRVTAPGGEQGYVERSYDPKKKMVVMENAFLNDVPSWIEAGTPMKPGKGTPTVAYLTMRQMKMLGAKYGETTTVKMSTIQNIEAVMQLEQMTRAGVPLEQAVAKTHSVTYATTTIQQSGQTVKGVRVDMTDAFPWKLSDMMNHFQMEPKERAALFSKYGLKPDDVMTVNYDIYLDLAPVPKKGTP